MNAAHAASSRPTPPREACPSHPPPDPPHFFLPQGTLRSILAKCSAQIEARPAGQGLWFPVGKDTARILRLASEEAVLLNSREKAPYLLLVEVRSLASRRCSAVERIALLSLAAVLFSEHLLTSAHPRVSAQVLLPQQGETGDGHGIANGHGGVRAPL